MGIFNGLNCSVLFGIALRCFLRQQDKWVASFGIALSGLVRAICHYHIMHADVGYPGIQMKQV